MLVDLTIAIKDPWLVDVLKILDDAAPTRIETGIYVGGFNQDKYFLEELDGRFADHRSASGVCDGPDQVKALFADLIDGPDPIAITLSPVMRVERPDGGLRWYKPGVPGAEEPLDDGDAQRMYVYHVYRVKRLEDIRLYPEAIELSSPPYSYQPVRDFWRISDRHDDCVGHAPTEAAAKLAILWLNDSEG